uniref:Uncharacterized protein n=1 Tax=Gopherus agassizii TaxID=38772 RepID=A0A452GKZ2_9SAUR
MGSAASPSCPGEDRTSPSPTWHQGLGQTQPQISPPAAGSSANNPPTSCTHRSSTSFYGRFRHFLDIVDPRTLFVTEVMYLHCLISEILLI